MSKEPATDKKVRDDVRDLQKRLATLEALFTQAKGPVTELSKHKGPRVVGVDDKSFKRLTCKNCAAIVEYVQKDVKSKSYSIMGDPSGHDEITCPSCKAGITIPGSSY